MISKKEIKICPYSGEEFTPKRNNQIYARSEYRIAHNNDKNNAKRMLMAPVNKSLSKNREILESILGSENENEVHTQFLRGKGFDFGVFTGFYNNPNYDNLSYEIYQFHFVKINNEYYKIYRNG